MLVEDKHWSEANVNIKIDNIMVVTESLRQVEPSCGSVSLTSDVSTS